MAIPSAWFGCPICNGKALRRRELWEYAEKVKCFSCGEWSKPDVLIGNEPTGAEILDEWLKESTGGRMCTGLNVFDGGFSVGLWQGSPPKGCLEYIAGWGETLDAAMADAVRKARGK